MGLDIGPMPDDPTEAALWRFVHSLNRSLPHVLDTDRFYEFIVVAHRRDCSWKEDKIQKLLTGRYRLSKRLAKEYARIYWVGRCTLLKQERIRSGDSGAVY